MMLKIIRFMIKRGINLSEKLPNNKIDYKKIRQIDDRNCPQI